MIKSVKRNEIQSDLICMNIIKRKIKNHHLITYNDEELILLIFRDYARILQEVLQDELY